MSATTRPIPYCFPDEDSVRALQARAMRQLSPQERWRQFVDLQSAWEYLHQRSPYRERQEKVWRQLGIEKCRAIAAFIRELRERD